MAISRLEKFGFSLGHVLNDLCASMWFTYTLIYYSKVMVKFFRPIAYSRGGISIHISNPFINM